MGGHDIDAAMRLVGARIVAFGMNAAGELYLDTDRGDKFVIGRDEHGEIALYEIEQHRSPA